jgi:hypothetical protein
MPDERTALLEQADRCRSQAQTIGADDAAARLTAMAQDYEEEASRLAAPSRPAIFLDLLGQLAKLTRQACPLPCYRFPGRSRRRAPALGGSSRANLAGTNPIKAAEVVVPASLGEDPI